MPDIICVSDGIPIMIEVKREGEVQSLLQKVTMDEWVAVKTICMVATKVEQIQTMMEDIARIRVGMIKEGIFDADIN